MELIISFTDQSESFTYGVEFGRLLNKMQNKESPIENDKFPVRVENRENIIRACKAYNYTPIFSECFVIGWVNFIAIKNIDN